MTAPGDSRLVLLSGVSRGLGAALALRLLSDGYRVAGIARSRSEAVEALAAEHADRFAFVQADLAETGAIPALLRDVTRDHGPLYGLVNNAAVGGDGLLATMHATDIERVLHVNLLAAITLAKYGCRSMLKAREGRIVNVSSIIARTGFSGLSVYAATKAGLEGFSRSLARELGKVGVTVNCVAPGYMETEMTAALQGDRLESIRRRSPLGLAETADAAGAVAYLLGPDAKRVTGTVLTVDGGSTA
ncbi:MAG: SDR family oxidoreductase [Myxococcota bacterium]